jgi:PTH1 family peptidyl-tRNA hydrolase
MFTIIGLGNPGDEYSKSRHNVGWMTLDEIHKQYDFSDWKEKKGVKAELSTGTIGKKKVTLVKPMTFMNKSGDAVGKLIKRAKQHEDVVVISDDLDIPLGSIKIMFNRGSGGHRGVESVIRGLKSEAFVRIKIGLTPTTATGKLKKPKGDDAVMKFVIKAFRPDEEKVVKKTVKRTVEAVEVMLNEGRPKAMSLYNN